MSLDIFKNRLNDKDYKDIERYYNHLTDYLINQCSENGKDLNMHVSLVKIYVNDYIYNINNNLYNSIIDEIGIFENWGNKGDNYIINLLDNDRRFLLTGCGNKNILVKYDIIKTGVDNEQLEK